MAPLLDEKTRSLLSKSFSHRISAEDLESEDYLKLSSLIFPVEKYLPSDKAEIEQWLTTISHIGSPSEDAAKTAERLRSLNTQLKPITFLLNYRRSVADIAFYSRLAPFVASWSREERTGEFGHHCIVRVVNVVQTSLFGLKLDPTERVEIDTSDVLFNPNAHLYDAKDRKKKEKAAAAAGADIAAASGATVTSAASESAQQAAAASKKEKQPKEPKSLGDKVAAAVGAEVPGVSKKEKKPKAPKAPAAADKPFSPALIDLRVGHILKAEKHPNADSLYVSTVACGDPAGADNTSEYEGKVVRTVCSGLNGLVPLEEMQGRKIVAVCNLKPVTMRGIKSAAMVLAASPRLAPGEEDHHGGPVELVNPPPDAEAGERVFFEGWEGEPEGQLNPKKKVWDDCQVGFTTTAEKVVAFEPGVVEKLKESGKTEVALLKTKQGTCTVKSLINATVR